MWEELCLWWFSSSKTLNISWSSTTINVSEHNNSSDSEKNMFDPSVVWHEGQWSVWWRTMSGLVTNIINNNNISDPHLTWDNLTTRDIPVYQSEWDPGEDDHEVHCEVVNLAVTDTNKSVFRCFHPLNIIINSFSVARSIIFSIKQFNHSNLINLLTIVILF